MDKQKQIKDKPANVPGFQVRSNLRAGASVEACQRNLDYWRKEYAKKCG